MRVMSIKVESDTSALIAKLHGSTCCCLRPLNIESDLVHVIDVAGEVDIGVEDLPHLDSISAINFKGRHVLEGLQE